MIRNFFKDYDISFLPFIVVDVRLTDGGFKIPTAALELDCFLPKDSGLGLTLISVEVPPLVENARYVKIKRIWKYSKGAFYQKIYRMKFLNLLNLPNFALYIITDQISIDKKCLISYFNYVVGVNLAQCK